VGVGGNAKNAKIAKNAKNAKISGLFVLPATVGVVTPRKAAIATTPDSAPPILAILALLAPLAFLAIQ
jgi:hypothetical protein